MTKTVVAPLIEIENVQRSIDLGKILNLFIKYVEFKIYVEHENGNIDG